ncbi:hypothetical protein AUK40_01785 [Candidatus Wirthbacteria bacterium CG2_30_54_11]|uniref:Glycosyltransferase RgtA/B/C/D-like domain-containing protein n=1 Tax=Candidatus Wirthbacteria bacterium CG2_30_54_11 TaxID=1817892 RepID=A0A1J5IYQ8_9BACT|nr:MAG: hypothetical protein AUK40_01785 [Candidatus Wirthbacteria bacterium CG2_30_54_11]
MSSIRIPKRFFPIAGFVLLTAVLLARIVYVVSRIDVSSTLRFLPLEYQNRAMQLLSGTPSSFPEAWGFFYIPLAMFYGFIDLLGLSEVRVEAFLTVQAVMGSLSVVFCYLLTRRICNKTASLLIAFTAALYYPLLYTHTLILSESLFTFLFLGFLLLLLRKQQSFASSVALGNLFALLLIVRPVFLSSIPFLLLWTLVYHRSAVWKNKLPIAAGLGSMALTLFIAGTLNASISTHHRFTLAGNGGVNVAMTQCQFSRLEYNLPDGSDSFWFSPPAYQGSEHESKMTEVPFSDQGYYLRLGAACLAEHPERLVENFKNIWHIYDSTFYPDLNSPSYHQDLLNFWRWIAIGATLLFFLFPLVWTRSERRIYLLFCGLVLSLYAIMYIGNPGEERYLVPYFFLLLPHAALTLVRGMHTIKPWLPTLITIETK